MPTTNLSRLLKPTIFDDKWPRFDRPWSPRRLTLLTIVSGLALSGLLFAMNERKLGWSGGPGLFVGCMIWSSFGFAVTFIGINLIAFAEFHWGSLAIVTAPKWISLGIALLIQSRQQRRFEIYRQMAIAEGPSWPLIACALSGIIWLVGIVVVINR